MELQRLINATSDMTRAADRLARATRALAQAYRKAVEADPMVPEYTSMCEAVEAAGAKRDEANTAYQTAFDAWNELTAATL